MAGCESAGQPFVTLCPNISLAPLPGVPPLGPGLPPARNDEERAIHAEIRGAILAKFDSGLPALNDARAALGLPPLEHLLDQFRAAEAELLATARAFDFPADRLPEKVRYLGPLVGDPHWARPWSSPWPALNDRPLVAVGFSTTFQDHAGVLQTVIDALAPLPVRVLVTLGARSKITRRSAYFASPLAPPSHFFGSIEAGDLAAPAASAKHLALGLARQILERHVANSHRRRACGVRLPVPRRPGRGAVPGCRAGRGRA
jgi:hypothetical protein